MLIGEIFTYQRSELWPGEKYKEYRIGPVEVGAPKYG